MTLSRRQVLRGATAIGAAGVLAARELTSPTRVVAQPRPGATAAGIKALIYDVFGTCVNWRNGVARDAQRILQPLGYELDWLEFADAWRALYQTTMEIVRNAFPWDTILGAEIAHDFKPKPAVYLLSAAALNLRPDEVMMCAAHSDDLKSAASNGLRTAHVARPGENGPGTGETAPRVAVDFAASSMEDLATQLGC